MTSSISWFRVFFWPGCLFFFSEIIAQVTPWFEVFSWIDIPFHFFGGVLIANSLHEFFLGWQAKGYIGKINPLLQILFITSMVVVVAVFWEFHEFLRDILFNTHLQRYSGDTMHDLFMGMMGGLMWASVLVQKKPLRK